MLSLVYKKFILEYKNWGCFEFLLLASVCSTRYFEILFYRLVLGI